MHLIEESLAAAIGAGLPIAEPVGRMVVDVGGGTSEVAVISLGGIVVSRSLRVGGYDLDDAITNYIRLEHRMAIGSQSAEAIKLAVGSASPLGEELSTRIRGRDLMSGLPRELELDSEEVRRAIDAPLADIMTSVHDTLEETPPELAADIAAPRHRAGRRRRAPARLLRARAPRDRHAGHDRRRAAHLRRHRRRPVARGARSHGPARGRLVTTLRPQARVCRAPGEVAEWLKALAC